MNKINRYITLAVMMLVPAGAVSQNYSIKRYTPSDGLNQSQVEEIFQDSRGYMWIGTRNGLSLFDGHDFSNFFEHDGLVDPYVFKVLEKSNGQIVAVTQLGFSTLTEEGFKPTPIYKKNSFNQISQAFMDNDDNLWLGCTGLGAEKELLCFRNDSVYNMSHVIDLPGQADFSKIIYDKNNDRILISSLSGEVWQYKDNEHTKLNIPEVILRFRNARGIIIVCHKGQKYVLKKDSLISIDHGSVVRKGLMPLAIRRNKRQYIDYFINPDLHISIPWTISETKKIFIDRDKIIWIPTEQGLFRIISYEFLNFTEKYGLAPNIWSLVEDSEHNIWFGSLEKSLQRWDGNELKDMNAFRRIEDGAFYNGGACTYDGRILFSQSQGILEYNNGRFSRFPYGESQAEKIYCSPRDSTLLIGFTKSGLLRIKGNSRKWTKELSAVKHGWVTDIAFDPDGFYWIVTSKTIAKLYDDSLYVYPYDAVPIQNGYVVEVDSSGTAWFGGQEGLFMHEKAGDNFREVNIQGNMITVNGLALMDDNRLLAGRMNDIVVIDIEKWKNGNSNFYDIYTEAGGFMGNEVQQDGIMRDHAGNYWISCIECVTKFMPSAGGAGYIPPLMNLYMLETMKGAYEWEEIYSPARLINNRPGQIQLDHEHNSVKLHFRAFQVMPPVRLSTATG